MLEALHFATVVAVQATLPLLILVFVVALVSSGAMGGFVFSTKVLGFKASRMNPLTGLQRMFSMKALIELAKAVAKFLLVAGVALAVLHFWSDDLLRLGLKPLPDAMSEGLELVAHTFVALSCSLILIAAVDVPIQLVEFNKQLKMTRQEVRDEMKDSEGRPEVKGRIRRLQQEIARRRMLADIPKADVVITNPEHYSVALQYTRNEDECAARAGKRRRSDRIPHSRTRYCEQRADRGRTRADARDLSLHRHRRRSTCAAVRGHRPDSRVRLPAETVPARRRTRTATARRSAGAGRISERQVMAQALLSASGGRTMRHLAQGNIGIPLLVLVLLAMMTLPVPPFLLDVSFTFNIALSLVVLLVSVYSMRPLDFAAFPTILLVSTLLRLALNVASTRVVHARRPPRR